LASLIVACATPVLLPRDAVEPVNEAQLVLGVVGTLTIPDSIPF